MNDFLVELFHVGAIVGGNIVTFGLLGFGAYKVFEALVPVLS